jgi:hypothetical protein
MKSLVQLSVAAALTAGFVVACAPPDNKAKIKDQTPEEKVQTILAQAFDKSYDPSLAENAAFAGKIEGVSAYIQEIKGTEKDAKSTFGIQVEIVINGEDESIVARGEIPPRKLTELAITQGAKDKYSVEAHCLSDICSKLAIRVKALAQGTTKASEAAQIFTREKIEKATSKTDKNEKPTTAYVTEGSAKAIWVANVDPKKLLGGKSASAADALKVRKPSKAGEKPAGQTGGAQPVAAKKTVDDCKKLPSSDPNSNVDKVDWENCFIDP